MPLPALLPPLKPLGRDAPGADSAAGADSATGAENSQQRRESRV